MVRTWQPRDWIVWIGWSVAISIGWGFCEVLLFVRVLGAGADRSTLLPTTTSSLLWLTQNVVYTWGAVSVIQAGLLFGYVRRISWWMLGWILATMVGWTGLWFFDFATAQHWLLNLAGSLAGSLGLGSMQWFVLRLLIPEPSRRRLSWWLLVYGGAALASGGSFLVGLYLSNVLDLLMFVVPGIVYGMLTGFALVSLFQRPHPLPSTHSPMAEH